MGFLTYEGKVAVVLLVFYLFYRFLLKKETFHRFNRVVLVGTAVLSFLLPLCIITIHKPVETVAGIAESPTAAEIAAGAADRLSPDLSPVVEASAPWWPTAFAILFWAGVAFVLAWVLISVLSVLKLVHQGERIREEDGCQIIVSQRDIDPFSWMKYIVLSRKDWETDRAPILAHEKAHIRFGHSAEILLVDVLSAFQWFNPAIWMLRADLQELHEYEADDAVLRAGAQLKEYQYLLIRKAVSKSGYSVANSFNHSILKNRITMMSKTKSPLLRGLRVLYVLPLVCLALGLQARTVYVPVDKDSEKFLRDETGDTAVVRTPAQSASDVIALSVKADGTLECGRQMLSLDQLKDVVKPAAPDQPLTTVQIVATDDVPLGVIEDVRAELRKIGPVRIRYGSPSELEGEIRNMPPYPAGKSNGKVEEIMPGVKRDNIFVVRINANDKYFFGDAPRQDDAEMLRVGKDFLRKRGKEARFSLQVDRGTSYGAYRHMQNLLLQIFVEMREEKAQEVYGKGLEELSPEELSEINQLVPIHISEAEMKKLKRK